MKEAIGCFYSKDYHQSKNLFEGLLKSISVKSERVEIYSYLIRINKYLNKSLQVSQSREYLELLFLSNDYQKFVETFYLLNQDLGIDIEYYLFDSLYQIGSIEKSLEVGKSIALKLVEEKIYNRLDEYLNQIEKFFKGYLFYDYARLIYYLEISNYSKSFESVELIVKKITSAWSLLIEKKKSQNDYILHLFKLISNFKVEDSLFQKKNLLLKAKLSRKYTDLSLSKKEIMEFVVLYRNEPEQYYLLSEIIKDEFIGYDLLDYLKKNNVKDTQAYKKKNIKIIEKYKKEISLIPEKKYVDLNVGDQNEKIININAIYDEYGVDVQKTNELALDLHQFDMLGDDSLSEVAYSLIEISHWIDAKEVISKIKNSEIRRRMKYHYYMKSDEKIEGLSYFSECLTTEISNNEYKEILGYISDLYIELGEKNKAQNTKALIHGLEVSLKDLYKALTNE